jgi:hypothetical protein
LLAVLTAVAPLPAQTPADPYQPIRSIGLPPLFAPYGGLAAMAGFDDGFSPGGRVFGGAKYELIRPVMGVLGVAAEGYGGVIGNELEGGARVYGTVRAFLLQAGVEFTSAQKWTPLFTMSIEDPIVRGGLLARGGMLRAEWTPAAHRLGLGFTVPLFQPLAGRTRPTRIAVEPPSVPATEPVPPLPDSLAAILDRLRISAAWIDEMTTPFLSSSLQTDREWQAELETRLAFIRSTDGEHPEGHTYPAEVAAYHGLLERLFRSASPMRADSLTALGRRVMLEEVLLPMNRQFGMLRSAEVLAAYRARASRQFASQLTRAGYKLAGGVVTPAMVFEGWLGVIATVEHRASRRWRDSRLTWLPFQLALTPAEHDTQAEIDRLLERLLDREFAGGSDFAYLINEAFSPELIRSIHAAAEYHVLWVHDFPGSAPDGRVDRVAARVVTEGYLPALTQRVREFDRTGRLPAFIVLLDQWYFDVRHGRWWMGLLADPLGRDVNLPEEAADVEVRVRAAQADLRQAVAESSRLQALARERGPDWLRRYVKVHVNITFPGEPSFRRRIPARTTPLMFADDYMRDHRKVAFWDLSERDPARGGALFTGEGVGEHYEGARWEDRTLLVRGPAALPLKQEARQLFLDHGFSPDQLPPALLGDAPAPLVMGDTDSVWSDWTTRLLHANNATGYGIKQASALKAALYTLVPAGSRLLVPDSQWSSFFWAGMLVGSALRGCHVFVIAPRPENAPYGDAFVQSVLTHDVLEGYLQLRTALADAFRASGGGLYVGLYGQDIGTRSLRQRYLAVIDGMRRPTFPRAAFPFPDEMYRRLSEVPVLEAILTPARDSGLVEPAPPTAPRLHLKTQLFASGAGLERVLRDPGWFQVFFAYVQQRAQEFARDRSLAAGGRMSPALLAAVDSALRRAPPVERGADVFYLLAGSQNQNDRSLLLDGEIMCLVAGVEALAPLIDFVAIAARSTWVETTTELDSLLPRQPRDKVKLARLLRSLF